MSSDNRIHTEIKGDKLVITVALNHQAYVSKSAIAKAVKNGLDPDKLAPNMLADTGGFVKVGDAKFSLNVMKG